jgi:hypothetical protein
MNTFNFKYIFPVSKTIQHYCSCVINRNIRKYLERKKLNNINKIVHIFLEESISKAKKQSYIRFQKIKQNPTFFINDRVKVEMGKGIVKKIREDGIIEILLELGLNTTSLCYYKKEDVSLIFDDKEVVNILLESTEETSEETEEDYSDDFIEESVEESKEEPITPTLENTEPTSIFSYITHTFYNVKKYIVG